MNEIQIIVFALFASIPSMGVGYFLCLYKHQKEILAGRSAIAKQLA